ncbi:MAG: porin [Bermanella sp.]
MKTPLLALVASMALASAAQADSKFYGKMNVAVGYEDESEVFGLQSSASRLGVKGSEDLGSVSVIYKAEYEIAIDDGLAGDKGYDINDDGTDDATDTNTIKPRDAYIGLKYNGMGTVKLGNMDTPLKKSQGKFDLFNDVVDLKKVLDGENRMANTVNYTTEKMGAFQSSIAVILPEDGSSEGISANIIYKTGGLYASAAVDNKVKGEATQRATLIYSLGDVKVGALVNNVDKDDVAGPKGDELGFAVNASIKMGVHTLKAQFESGEQKEAGASSFSLGIDHKLAKSTKVFAFFNQFSADDKDEETTVLALGLEHKF